MSRANCVAAGVLAVVACSITACTETPPAKEHAARPETRKVAGDPPPAVAAAPTEEEPADEAAAPTLAEGPVAADDALVDVYEPKVALSEAHAQASLIKVGDAFPPLTANNLEGKPVDLSSLRGPKLTVVVFWSAKLLYAREEFRRLGPEVAARYAPLGVKVVAINVGDSVDVVKKLAAEQKASFPCLVDPEQKAFAQVAKAGLPRTYVLDAQGKVLWFDLEYSRPMRRELNNAVHFFTQAPKPANVN